MQIAFARRLSSPAAISELWLCVLRWVEPCADELAQCTKMMLIWLKKVYFAYFFQDFHRAVRDMSAFAAKQRLEHLQFMLQRAVPWSLKRYDGEHLDSHRVLARIEYGVCVRHVFWPPIITLVLCGPARRMDSEKHVSILVDVPS